MIYSDLLNLNIYHLIRRFGKNINIFPYPCRPLPPHYPAPRPIICLALQHIVNCTITVILLLSSRNIFLRKYRESPGGCDAPKSATAKACEFLTFQPGFAFCLNTTFRNYDKGAASRFAMQPLSAGWNLTGMAVVI